MSEYTVSRMTKNEIQIAIDWAAKEGWNPGLYDLECFYAVDPQGFFIGKLNGEPIAVASGVVYDDNFAFCGFYIVKPEYRGKGYGMQITQARLDYIGNRCTGIDGVMEMVEKYKNIGYKTLYQDARYLMRQHQVFAIDPHITPVADIAFDELCQYDRKYFPAERRTFLEKWVRQPESYALVYIKDSKIFGYGVSRKCGQGYKIGPLFAESPEVADALFRALITSTNCNPYFLDIPKSNASALALVNKYNMEEVFKAERMYRNGTPDINVNNVYGITTFELG